MVTRQQKSAQKTEPVRRNPNGTAVLSRPSRRTALHSEHPVQPTRRATTQTHRLNLVAVIAVTGLSHSALCPEDRADFYEGLSAILSPGSAEAAKYAATCVRECQRAQQDLLTALGTGEGGD